jgi:hypothetical protein
MSLTPFSSKIMATNESSLTQRCVSYITVHGRRPYRLLAVSNLTREIGLDVVVSVLCRRENTDAVLRIVVPQLSGVVGGLVFGIKM